MPVCFIEAPPGICTEAKKRMVEKITSAIGEAYYIGDTLIFLREYPAENVAQDGRFQSEKPKDSRSAEKDWRLMCSVIAARCAARGDPHFQMPRLGMLTKSTSRRCVDERYTGQQRLGGNHPSPE